MTGGSNQSTQKDIPEAPGEHLNSTKMMEAGIDPPTQRNIFNQSIIHPPHFSDTNV